LLIDERSESRGRGPAGSAGGEGARPLSIDERTESQGNHRPPGGQRARPLFIDERSESRDRSNGRPPHRRKQPEALAFVFQEAHLLPWRTLIKNVMLPLELRGVPRGERADRAVHMLERVGLADARDRYPAQLSGGMQLRGSLARALVTEPRLLLL